jgi:molybdopterin/thiamine biosynthesis adenylyltransferase
MITVPPHIVLAAKAGRLRALDCVTRKLVDYAIDRRTEAALRAFAATQQLPESLGALLTRERLIAEDGMPPEGRYKIQHTFLSAFLGPEKALAAQERLARASVTIVGLGGIGSWIALTLAGAGVGHMTLIDPDRVEESNLHRQPLYHDADTRKAKAAVAAERIRAMNPRARVDAISRSLSRKVLHQLTEVDLVVCCADEPSVEDAGRIVGSFCFPRGIPHIISGGYSFHAGFLGPTIVPGKSACWNCFIQHERGRDPFQGYDILFRAKSGGTVGPVAGIIAQIHAWEALRVLTGMQPRLLGAQGEFDFMGLTIRIERIFPRVPCACAKLKGAAEKRRTT